MIQNIFGQGEPIDDIYHVKQEFHDKTTHHVSQQNNKDSNYLNPFQSSPQRNSFFLTSNSPKPFFFDLSHQGEDGNRRSSKNNSFGGATINKKINLQQECQVMEEEQSDSYPESQQIPSRKHTPNRSIKNAKGLRNLSESVYRIVSQLSVTKYKEVADRLVSEISHEQNQRNKITKDQHNIKRRVYDALNVLIAAGILRKEGKEVACNEPFRQGRKNLFRNSKQTREKAKIQNEFQKMSELLKIKKDKLERLCQRKKIIEYVFNRNKQEKKKQQILTFPLICFVSENNFIQVEQSKKDLVFMKFSEKPQIYGDVDLLAMIDTNNLSSEKISTEVKSEQVKFDYFL